MAYIKQIGADVYVVNATEPLAEFAAVAEHPDLFEIVEGEPPAGFAKLNYTVAA